MFSLSNYVLSFLCLYRKTTLNILGSYSKLCETISFKFEKCEFWPECVAFLRHIISRDEFSVDLPEIEAVLSRVKPKNTS